MFVCDYIKLNTWCDWIELKSMWGPPSKIWINQVVGPPIYYWKAGACLKKKLIYILTVGWSKNTIKPLIENNLSCIIHFRWTMVSIFSWSQLSIRLKVFSHIKHQSNFIFPLNWKNKRPIWYYSLKVWFRIWNTKHVSIYGYRKNILFLRKKFPESKIKKTKQGRI